MTRDVFIDKAVREAERKLGVPAGWWGTYNYVQAPRCFISVRWSSIAGWRVYGADGAFVSAHDSRRYAIKKAVGLWGLELK